ncbi:hypothetical protein O9993_09570 [Vibrio lentus]|nr:hypothetical protein [Vibrio lentus]
MSNIVIVGGGFAALQTIKMVRQKRPDIAITMITADAGLSTVAESSRRFDQEQPPKILAVHNAQQLAKRYNVVAKTKSTCERDRY